MKIMREVWQHRSPVQQHFLSCPHIIWSPERRLSTQSKNRDMGNQANSQNMKFFPPDNISSQRWTPYSVTRWQLGGFLEELPKESSNSRCSCTIFASNPSSFFRTASRRSLKQHRIHSLLKMILRIVFQQSLRDFHLFHLCKESVLKKNLWWSFVLLKDKCFKSFHAFLLKTLLCLEVRIKIKSELNDTHY